MFFALNDKKEKVNISFAQCSDNYYCPVCGKRLIIKKGNTRIHHFAHISTCKDNWDKKKNDMSEWHRAWQSEFPDECQEYVFNNKHGSHRADIYRKYKKTVIEFQHCSISNDEFNQRNKFYTLSGNRLIWIFDYSNQLILKDDYIILNENEIIYKLKKDKR